MSDVKLSFDIDTARAVSKLDRLNKKVEGAGGGLMDAAKSFAGIATAAVTVGSAFEVAMRKIEQFNEMARKSFDLARSQQTTMGQLLALPGTVEEKRARLAAANATAREAGISLPAAQTLQFQLESLGLQGNRQTFAQVAALQFDAGAVARGVGRLGQVSGRTSAPQIDALANLVFQGAARSEVGPDAFAEAAASVAIPGQAIGSSPEEIVNILANVKGGDIRVLSTALKSLAVSAGRQNFQGGLVEFTRGLQERGGLRSQLIKDLGREEAAVAFDLITGNMAAIQSGSAIAGYEGAIPRALQSAKEASPEFARLLAVGSAEAEGGIGLSGGTTFSRGALFRERAALLDAVGGLAGQIPESQITQGELGEYIKEQTTFGIGTGNYVLREGFLPEGMTSDAELKAEVEFLRNALRALQGVSGGINRPPSTQPMIVNNPNNE